VNRPTDHAGGFGRSTARREEIDAASVLRTRRVAHPCRPVDKLGELEDIDADHERAERRDIESDHDNLRVLRFGPPARRSSNA
jgi:hypothetical protein